MNRRATTLVLVAALALSAFPACFADTSIDATAAPKVDNGVSSGHATTTDATSIHREKESMSNTANRLRSGAEQFAFQAEVSRLMDIIINSLYSNKDIFLRELISNASDALDKIRFLSLTDKAQLGEGEAANLDIKIWLDAASRTLNIRDRGIGMTKDDLVKNLGTIAKSGTSAFLEQMQKGGDMNLIGQFGVGFYSVYLVADYVEVVSKHNDDKQYIWASTADGSFSISEDTENEPLGRGTLIKIHLKEEAQEYANEAKLKELVQRYSEFINFPIYLQAEKEVEVPVEEEAEEAKEEDKAEAEAEEEEEEEEGAEDDEEETKEEAEKLKATRKEKRMEWELLNDNKAIWLRKPSEVTEEEYQKFYKAVSKDYSDALAYTHFRAEGDVEFRSILYIPSFSPYDFYDKYYEKAQNGLKLYVRRVFISDDMKELIPRYLSFVKGIVDSDTLPLNVSREMLQQEAALKTIKKKVVRKVLDLIKKMAETEVKCKDMDEKGETEGKPSEKDCGQYGKFWEQFGRSIKLGIIEDTTHRNRLAKLLRVYTSKSGDKLTTLDEYVSRMKEGQKSIYYLAGASKEEVASSPHLERLLRKGYEVIYFTDVLDEYVMGHLLDYDDKKFVNASKDDLKLSDKDEVEKKKDKELKEEFKDLTKWWKKVIEDSRLQTVKVSNRLATTPCVVVSGKYGQSANMERIMRAQAFSRSAGSFTPGQRVLEINPRHPLIVALKDKLAAASEDTVDETTVATARILYETALLESGFIPDDAKSFSQRVYSVLKGNLGVESLDVQLEDDDAAEEPAATEAATDAEAKDEL
ncbi:hypothetical protein VOLCADRAFT_80696 [Volvox carteri f. nagariensis]|uniref:Histidine kinase/HSP90-like ATPase domain-containing protein n=1 Tax=Volvox carteri f. nagariensis TaxID=3068 RepID=D8TT40_VOLCA|nr:uncharacterized protein VOLCADRAFT_80696 [Volvox carteri f. nagariensis]EFJ49245.1 hypothetical protein VOLCADRAFT_80696 [Volvox carteri f. nagariensis]|eukprot:XP_002949693.1 hypothetical protein VOLCADRAFT_80696 [Volvox carteri f. nagariensis]